MGNIEEDSVVTVGFKEGKFTFNKNNIQKSYVY